MKRLVLLPLLLILLSAYSSSGTQLTLKNTPVSIYFSPKGGCTDAIVEEINRAQKEVLIQAYSFTSVPIAKALLNAHKRGVRVEAILDKSQKSERYTSATFLANGGIRTWIDDSHAIAHNKVIIVDQTTIVTGSFNFTKAAEEKNAENLMILRSKDLAQLYLDNWLKHREHSEGYRARY